LLKYSDKAAFFTASNLGKTVGARRRKENLDSLSELEEIWEGGKKLK